MSAQHTPGEWKVAGSDSCLILDDYSAGLGPWRFIATTRDDDHGALPRQQAEANAARIVQCVNAHDALVEALAEICDISDAGIANGAYSKRAERLEALYQRARAALAKAGSAS